MVTQSKQGILPLTIAFALLAVLTASCWGGGYSYTQPGPATPATQDSSGYVVFAATEPSTQAPSGWVGPGQYSLPPDVGGVGIGVSAAGSTAHATGSAAGQSLVVRLAVAATGSQLFTIDPSRARLSDDAGHVVVGATAYSDNRQVTQISLGPGGRDDVQLAFILPPTMNVAALAALSVDLPYQYGSRSEVAHFQFAPAPAGIGGGGASAAAPTGKTYIYNNYSNQPGYADSGYMDYFPGYMGGYGGSSWWAPGWGWPTWGWWSPRWSLGGGVFDADDFIGHGRHHQLEELLEHRGRLARDPPAAARLGAASRPAAQQAAAARACGQSRVFVAPGTEMQGARPRTFVAPQASTPRVTQPRVFNAPRIETPRFESAPRSFAAPAPRNFSAPRSFSSPAPGGGMRGGGFSGGFSGRGAGGFSGGGRGGGGGAHRSS